MKTYVYAIATMDTKAEEIAYVATCLKSAGASVKVVDVSTSLLLRNGEAMLADVSRDVVLGETPLPETADRGASIAVMGDALKRFLLTEYQRGTVAGVIGIGGSGGTALITKAMRALPIGLPKLMVSTVASGNTSGYVDCSDITMMYSVVDVAGLNVVSRIVLGNAAHAVAGMVARAPEAAESRPALGMTMFGVTTPCVTAIRESLEAKGYDCLVFHATGAGGRAMEQLVESQLIQGVLDITTTEVADEIVGGIFPAGTERFDRLLQARIPLVLSVGAVDMVNFGALASVPPQFAERRLHVHNDQITLMRTNVEENRQIARWMAGKLNQSTSAFTMLLPEKGVSMLDNAGEPFEDQQANAVLFSELEARVVQSESRRVIRLPFHINDPEFSAAAVLHFEQLATALG
ncbi:MAG: Tm-1-like ATP-binding domain-containing protein [Fuerstiella sp.]